MRMQNISKTDITTPATAARVIEVIAGATCPDPRDGRYRCRHWSSGKQTVGVFAHVHDLDDETVETFERMGFERTEKNENVIVWWFDAIEHHKSR